MSERATCETCKWWDGGDARGMCRKSAPTASEVGRVWPWTFRSDWCGEHQPREARDE